MISKDVTGVEYSVAASLWPVGDRTANLSPVTRRSGGYVRTGREEPPEHFECLHKTNFIDVLRPVRPPLVDRRDCGRRFQGEFGPSLGPTRRSSLFASNTPSVLTRAQRVRQALEPPSKARASWTQGRLMPFFHSRTAGRRLDDGDLHSCDAGPVFGALRISP